MSHLLAEKTALVTGGSRGIGRAIALELAAAGADVAFTYHQNETEAQTVVAEIEAMGQKALAFQADAADFNRAGELIQAILNDWGRLDILVNNAGIHQNEAIWATSEDQWDRVLDVNLKGAFNYIRATAPLFREQKAGKIVNITSIHGLRGRRAGPNYSAAKAGMIGLTKSVTRDLSPYGVNVNAVAPGIIETDLVRALPKKVRDDFVAGIVLGRIGLPEDVAHLVVFLCSELARHITGEVIKVDGGQYI